MGLSREEFVKCVGSMDYDKSEIMRSVRYRAGSTYGTRYGLYVFVDESSRDSVVVYVYRTSE